MAEDNASRRRLVSYTNLPTELRLQILEHVVAAPGQHWRALVKVSKQFRSDTQRILKSSHTLRVRATTSSYIHSREYEAARSAIHFRDSLRQLVGRPTLQAPVYNLWRLCLQFHTVVIEIHLKSAQASALWAPILARLAEEIHNRLFECAAASSVARLPCVEITTSSSYDTLSRLSCRLSWGSKPLYRERAWRKEFDEAPLAVLEAVLWINERDRNKDFRDLVL